MESLNPLPISNSRLITIDINESLGPAHSLMLKAKIRHLIVTKDGEAIGMLSDRDVMRAINVQVHDFYSVRVREESFDREVKVGDVMGWPIHTLDHSAPLTEMVDLLLVRKISCVLLTKENAVSGILTTDDLLRILKRIVTEQQRHNEPHPTSLQAFLAKIYTSPVGHIFDSLSNSGI